MPLSLTYNLIGTGWSECLVEIDGQRAELTASYLSDALGGLLRAVANLLRGVDDNSVSFDEEPGEYRWRLTRAGPEELRVRVLWFDEMWGNKPDEAGKVVFDARCRLRTFAGAVLSAAQHISDEYGTEGYRERWARHDFPLERLEEIRRLLRGKT